MKCIKPDILNIEFKMRYILNSILMDNIYIEESQ